MLTATDGVKEATVHQMALAAEAGRHPKDRTGSSAISCGGRRQHSQPAQRQQSKSLTQRAMDLIDVIRHQMTLTAVAGVLLLALGLCVGAIALLAVPEEQTVVACAYPALAVSYAIWVSWSRAK